MTDGNQVYISSSCFPLRNSSELLDHCASLDLHDIELGCNLDYEKSIGHIYQKSSDFKFLIHNYFPAPKLPFVLNLASTDKNILEQSIDHCRKAIDLCSELNISFFSVHSGFLANLSPNDLGADKILTQYKRVDKEIGLDIFIKSVKTVLEYGIKKNVDLLIENNVVNEINLVNGEKELCLMVQTDEILEFLNSFDNPHIGLLADVGHLNVMANLLNFSKADFFVKLGKHIKAFHLSGNNGKIDQNLPFDENEWFVPILRQKEFQKLPKILELNKNVPPAELLNCIRNIFP